MKFTEKIFSNGDNSEVLVDFCECGQLDSVYTLKSDDFIADSGLRFFESDINPLYWYAASPDRAYEQMQELCYHEVGTSDICKHDMI